MKVTTYKEAYNEIVKVIFDTLNAINPCGRDNREPAGILSVELLDKYLEDNLLVLIPIGETGDCLIVPKAPVAKAIAAYDGLCEACANHIGT